MNLSRTFGARCIRDLYLTSWLAESQKELDQVRFCGGGSK